MPLSDGSMTTDYTCCRHVHYTTNLRPASVLAGEDSGREDAFEQLDDQQRTTAFVQRTGVCLGTPHEDDVFHVLSLT